MKINVSGRLYEIAAYEVDRETSLIDMDEVARIARDRRPKLLIAGWSAYPRQLDFARFREIADEVGALLMVDMAHFAGLVRDRTASQPARARRRRRHDDDPQDARRPRAGIILCKEELSKKIDPLVFPGQQGRALEHVIAAKAVALQIAKSELFAERQRRTVAGAQAVAEALLDPSHRWMRAGPPKASTCSPAAQTCTCARRPARPAARAERQAGRGPAARDRDHRQPQRRPLRPATADGGLRPAHRHPALATRGLRREDFAEVGQIIAATLAHPGFRARRRRAVRAGAGDRRALSALRSRCLRSAAGAGAPRVRPLTLRCCPASMPNPTVLDALYAFLVAAAVTALLTPLTMRIARALGAIDEPRERGLSEARHRCSVALAIFAGVLVAALIWLPEGYGGAPRYWHGVLLAAALITLVGALDDRFDLPPIVKLAGQVAAA